ncbi:MAG: hypothetical protein IKQ36_04060 [Clostridia bacterium]|nr:hypothetical protein [Clostridia bacterium]
MIKRFAVIMAVIMMITFAACINTTPGIDPSSGPERDGRANLKTPDPKDEGGAYSATEAPTEAPEQIVDELGVRISGAEHFQRYLTFRTILVYEEDGDTFLDGMIFNDYVKPITCAVDVVYTAEDGSELARARLQTRDGKYLLVLQPGENVVYARILTDTTLTELEYEMEFDKDIGVKPIN